MEEFIFEYIESQQDEVIYLQRELVCRPALSPENGGKGEEEKAQFLLSYLKTIGIPKFNIYRAKDPRVPCGYRPNIAAILPGRDAKRTLWIVSHLDVVPPGDMGLWDTDPFTLFQEGDLLYGRGVEDNNQGIVSSIIAAKAFIHTNVTPKINLGILLVADEETGNKYGLEFLFNNHRDIFEGGDEFLIPDFGSKESDMIEIAEKGMLWLRVEVIGRQCHASTPDKGKNSLVASSAFILELRKLYSVFPQKDSLFSPPYSTFEATRKEENVPNINTIPGKDVFYLDCRILPRYKIKEVINIIEDIGRDIKKKYGVDIKYEVVHSESSPPTSREDPLVKKLQQAVKKIYGVVPTPRGVGGGTVAVYPRKHRFSAAVWSTILGYAHQPNECSSIKNTLNDAKVMVSLLHC